MLPREATRGVGLVNTYKEWAFRDGTRTLTKLIWGITKGTKKKNPAYSDCP